MDVRQSPIRRERIGTHKVCPKGVVHGSTTSTDTNRVGSGYKEYKLEADGNIQ